MRLGFNICSPPGAEPTLPHFRAPTFLLELKVPSSLAQKQNTDPSLWPAQAGEAQVEEDSTERGLRSLPL